jgi:hypothetical protein
VNREFDGFTIHDLTPPSVDLTRSRARRSHHTRRGRW